MQRRSLLTSLALLPLMPAQAQTIALQLPAKPSELLEAPLATWLPLLDLMSSMVEGELANPDGISPERLTDVRIAQTLIAQGREHWAQVRALAERARRVQVAEAGKLTAGVVNELLAAQRLGRHNGDWLRRATAERFGAMPWATVGPVVRSLHQQLQGATAEGLKAYVQRRTDLSANMAKGQVNLGFAVQLLGMRLQLLHVLPQREALVAGLADVLARHPEDAKPAAQPAVQPAVQPASQPASS